jgi:hypothetical protein
VGSAVASGVKRSQRHFPSEFCTGGEYNLRWSRCEPEIERSFRSLPGENPVESSKEHRDASIHADAASIGLQPRAVKRRVRLKTAAIVCQGLHCRFTPGNLSLPASRLVPYLELGAFFFLMSIAFLCPDSVPTFRIRGGWGNVSGPAPTFWRPGGASTHISPGDFQP